MLYAEIAIVGAMNDGLCLTKVVILVSVFNIPKHMITSFLFNRYLTSLTYEPNFSLSRSALLGRRFSCGWKAE